MRQLLVSLLVLGSGVLHSYTQYPQAGTNFMGATAVTATSSSSAAVSYTTHSQPNSSLVVWTFSSDTVTTFSMTSVKWDGMTAIKSYDTGPINESGLYVDHALWFFQEVPVNTVGSVTVTASATLGSLAEEVIEYSGVNQSLTPTSALNFLNSIVQSGTTLSLTIGAASYAYSGGSLLSSLGAFFPPQVDPTWNIRSSSVGVSDTWLYALDKNQNQYSASGNSLNASFGFGTSIFAGSAELVPQWCTNPQVYDGYALASMNSETTSSSGPNGPLIVEGTALYATSPSPPNSGTFSFTSFTSSNYLLTSANENTQLSYQPVSGIDFWWYPTSISGGSWQKPLSVVDSFMRSTEIQVGFGSAYPEIAGSSGDSFQSSLSITANAWNELTLEWDQTGVYLFIDGKLGYHGYGVGWGFQSISAISLGADQADGSPGDAASPISGYMTQIHFLGAAVDPPILDVCSQTPQPTITPYTTYVPTPIAAESPAPQCWPTPGAVLTIAASPIITPMPTPGQAYPNNLGEPGLSLRTDDTNGNHIHVVYTWENNDSGIFSIHLATASGLNPAAPNGVQGSMTEQGILVGQGVLGVNDTVHGGLEVNLGGGVTRLFYGDSANGDIMEANSSDGGYHYLTSSVAVAFNLSTISSNWWYPNTVGVAFTTAVFPAEDGNANDWYGIVELDNSTEYGPFGGDLLWLIKSTDNAVTFQSASPLPLMSTSCGGLGVISQGPRAVSWNASGGYWDCWESTTQAGPVYHLRSAGNNPYIWQCDGVSSIHASQLPVWPPAEFNEQVADVSGGIQYLGFWWFAASESDNVNNTGVSFLFWFPGTQQNYDACSIPTYSPTCTISPTFSVSPTFSISPTMTPTPTNTPTSTISPTPLRTLGPGPFGSLNIAGMNPPGTAQTQWCPHADNGPVLAMISLSNTVYCVGQFTTVQGGFPRNYAAAFNQTTGILMPWNPNLNGVARAITLTGGFGGPYLAIGGDFSTVGGTSHKGVALVDTINGTPLSWNPLTTGIPSVDALDLGAGGNYLFAGGLFTAPSGQINAVEIGLTNPAQGVAPIQNWAPNPDARVMALAETSSQTMILGGSFQNCGGVPRALVAEVTELTGMATAWNPSISGLYGASSVSAIEFEGGIVYLGGAFLAGSSGTIAMTNLGAFSWPVSYPLVFAPNPNGSVATLTWSSPYLVAGGYFTLIGDAAKDGIAAIVPVSTVQIATPNITPSLTNTLTVSPTPTYTP